MIYLVMYLRPVVILHAYFGLAVFVEFWELDDEEAVLFYSFSAIDFDFLWEHDGTREATPVELAMKIIAVGYRALGLAFAFHCHNVAGDGNVEVFWSDTRHHGLDDDVIVRLVDIDHELAIYCLYVLIITSVTIAAAISDAEFDARWLVVVFREAYCAG